DSDGGGPPIRPTKPGIVARCAGDVVICRQYGIEKQQASERNLLWGTRIPGRFRCEAGQYTQPHLKRHLGESRRRLKARGRCRHVHMGEPCCGEAENDGSEHPLHFDNRSRTFLVMRSTTTSPPRRPWAQSVLPHVTTVPPRV